MLVTLLVLLVLGGYTSWTAGRLDRLHARVDAGWAALDAALVRRAAAARLLAGPPARAEPAPRLARAADAALGGGPVGREDVENDLTAALRAARLDLAPTRTGSDRYAGRDPGAYVGTSRDPGPDVGAGPGTGWQEVADATSRVQLSRSFHNTAVANARAQRRRWFVRYLHLAGHRVMPRPFDIDDGDL